MALIDFTIRVELDAFAISAGILLVPLPLVFRAIFVNESYLLSLFSVYCCGISAVVEFGESVAPLLDHLANIAILEVCLVDFGHVFYSKTIFELTFVTKSLKQIEWRPIIIFLIDFAIDC